MDPFDNLEILTVPELMELLYIGKNTAYQLLNEGHIKAFRYLVVVIFKYFIVKTG